MQYLIRCGFLMALLATGCSAKMQGYADTSGPPASGVDQPAGSAKKVAKAADASSDADAKGEDKASSTDASGDKK
jgi:hypothetical protein